MVSRLARLLLVSTLVLAGVTSCPRGVPACGTSVRVAHACCAKNALRRGSTCCCAGTGQASPLLGTTAASHHDGPSTKLMVRAALLQSAPAVSAPGASVYRTRAGKCLPLPDTLVTLHSSLLL